MIKDCFLFNDLSLHLTICCKSFTQSFTIPFVFMDMYIVTYYLQGWRFNDYVICWMWLLNLEISLDFGMMTWYIVLKHLDFDCVILFSKLCLRCSLLGPWWMTQTRYKIEQLFKYVGCWILEQNEHFPKNPIKQSNCCVATSCNSVARFKFITSTHAQVCWQLL